MTIKIFQEIIFKEKRNCFLYAKYLAYKRESNTLELSDLQTVAIDMADFILDIDKKNIDKLFKTLLEVDLWNIIMKKY